MPAGRPPLAPLPSDPRPGPDRIDTGRLELRPLDVATARQVLTGGPPGRAVDFPGDGTAMAAALLVLAADCGAPAVPASRAVPWGGPWLVRHAGLAVGSVALAGDPSDGPVELGYDLAPSARGHGFATEAAGALLRRARAAGARDVLARTDPANRSSTRLLARLGFAPVDEPAGLWRWPPPVPDRTAGGSRSSSGRAAKPGVSGCRSGRPGTAGGGRGTARTPLR